MKATFEVRTFRLNFCKELWGGDTSKAVHLRTQHLPDDPRQHIVESTMLQFLLSGEGALSPPPASGRQHPLLLWFDLLDGKNGPLFVRYWLSLGAYYLLLFACSWFVLQWFRRGRPWARARSLLVGHSRGGGDENQQHQLQQQLKRKQKKKHAAPPRLLYMESPRNRRLLAKTTVLRQPYVPSPWLGHRVSERRRTVVCSFLGLFRVVC